jgi:hypothetical protein
MTPPDAATVVLAQRLFETYFDKTPLSWENSLSLHDGWLAVAREAQRWHEKEMVATITEVCKGVLDA